MKPFIIFCFAFIQVACAQQQQKQNSKNTPALSIIPQPVSIKQSPGHFVLDKKTVIAVKDEADRKPAQFLNDYLQQVYGFKLDIDKQEGKNYIRLSTKKFIKAPDKDAYTLQVTKEGVTIEGDTYAGTFYGVQTLIQLLPADNSTPQAPHFKFQIPLVSIQDHPRFNYRGMHLDVARHLFPLSFIKKYIDYLALHKMNYFHWHLTDDQGWRIEIKKYPELMTVGAYRNGTIIGRYPGKGNDNMRYGGYYTQEEIKEIVQYAADRHITVVPEIEMPGHASAAIAAYPWLSCFPDKPTLIPRTTPATGGHQGTKKVQETWGVFEDVFCAGNDSTFMFLQNVMDEVLALFPSPYIHVGGDECPKKHWKQCPKCQSRIKNEGLKDEHELQSYFIQRMEKYLNNKGRILIGWDEILEGGLAPNAIVMSWRGEKGGIEAARQKHQVIMTPQKPVYFDHTQSKNEDSVTIGGYNPIEAVYAYEPVPEELSKELWKYVLGAQANVWTEYIKYPSKVEYMIFPRMSALSEVLWSPKEKKNWKDFDRRLGTQFKRYDLWKANYSRAYFNLKATVLPTKNFDGVLWAVENRTSGAVTIHYNNGDAVWTYTGPQLIKTSLHAFASANNGLAAEQKFTFSKATGKKILLKEPPSPKYAGDGAFTLVNGVINEKGFVNATEFLGFEGRDGEALIDLGRTQPVNAVRTYTLSEINSWIFPPQSVEVSCSTDGKKYSAPVLATQAAAGRYFEIALPDTRARYIKVIIKNHGIIQGDHPGAGNRAWLFVDEIQVL